MQGQFVTAEESLTHIYMDSSEVCFGEAHEKQEGILMQYPIWRRYRVRDLPALREKKNCSCHSRKVSKSCHHRSQVKNPKDWESK